MRGIFSKWQFPSLIWLMCTAYLADMYRIDFVTLRVGLFTTFARLSMPKLLGLYAIKCDP